MNNSIRKALRMAGGFTFIELVVVMIVLGIAALLAVPMFSSAADSQLQAAANTIAADLEYVKNLAITRQMNLTVVFDSANESYLVQETATGTTIAHPTKAGSTFTVNFAPDHRTNQVDFTALFDGVSSITFDYLGTPYSGTGTASAMAAGQISLTAGTFSTTVTVEPVTGYVSIP